MAHFTAFVIAQVNATLEQGGLVANVTDTAKPKSTPEGMLTAYVSLVVMALIPIFVGAFKSVDHHLSQKQKSRVSLRDRRSEIHNAHDLRFLSDRILVRRRRR